MTTLRPLVLSRLLLLYHTQRHISGTGYTSWIRKLLPTPYTAVSLAAYLHASANLMRALGMILSIDFNRIETALLYHPTSMFFATHTHPTISTGPTLTFTTMELLLPLAALLLTTAIFIIWYLIQSRCGSKAATRETVSDYKSFLDPYQDIEPCEDQHPQCAPPLRIRPFKPKFHLTMGEFVLQDSVPLKLIKSKLSRTFVFLI